jgi:hypothetical protein
MFKELNLTDVNVGEDIFFQTNTIAMPVKVMNNIISKTIEPTNFRYGGGRDDHNATPPQGRSVFYII